MIRYMKIGEICDILNGYAFKSSRYINNKGIRVIRITNVQKGYIEDAEPKFYPEKEINEIKKFMLEDGDLLISLTGNVGRVALIDKSMLPAALNQRVGCIRINKKDLIYKPYLYHLLNSDYFEKQCINSSNGIAQKNMSTEWLKEYYVPVYSMDYQKKIATIFDKIDIVIKKHYKQIDILDKIAKSLFIEMFGDPVENPFMFEKQRLSKIGELERGVSKHRPRNAPELLGGKYPLIQTGEISNSDLYINKFENTYSELGLSQSKLWKKGTLCITIAANIAKTGILTFDSCFPDSVVGFVPNKLTNNIFIHYWFSFFQKILEEEAPESAQKNINLKVLSNLDVIVPPIELQNKFAAVVAQIDKSKLAVKKSLEELEILKKSLMQEYFA